MIRETSELSREQLDRIDAIHNAAHEFCKVMTEQPNLVWNMEYIGVIADFAAEVMTGSGFSVRFPHTFEVRQYADSVKYATPNNADSCKTFTADFYEEG